MENNQNNNLRQAYIDFYRDNVVGLELEIQSRQDKYAFNPSSEYKQYTWTATGLFIGGFILCITFCLMPIGIFLIIAAIIMFICMPKKLKEEAQHLNEVNEQIAKETGKDIKNYSEAINNHSTDTQTKRLLMDKFLSIFGDFKWNKGHTFFDINNLIILPDKLSLDTDDCMTGRYEGAGIKLTEVYFGFNALTKSIKKHEKLLGYLFPSLIIFFFINFFSFIFVDSPELRIKLMHWYMISFFIVWGLGFFAPVIYLIIFLVNRNSHGLIIEIDMPKSFEGETVIFENSPSNFVVNKAKLKNFKRTQLEDIEFNKKYLTYTTNQIEARYILTAAFIERLKNIKFVFNAKYMRILFRNNRITIFAQVYKDLFAMAKNDKTDKQVFDQLFKEIYSVLSLVDNLKLNVKTGL